MLNACDGPRPIVVTLIALLKESVLSLVQRPRRLRQTPAVRRLVAETRLHPADLVLPLFVVEGLDDARPITAMPGVMQHSLASLAEAAREAMHSLAGSAAAGALVDSVTTATAPVRVEYSPNLHRYVASYRVTLRRDFSS